MQQVMTSYSVVSDGHAHKVPVWRVERAGGGDGCEDIRWDRCARPSAVRVTGGLRSFSEHHFFRIVHLPYMEAASAVRKWQGSIEFETVFQEQDSTFLSLIHI